MVCLSTEREQSFRVANVDDRSNRHVSSSASYHFVDGDGSMAASKETKENDTSEATPLLMVHPRPDVRPAAPPNVPAFFGLVFLLSLPLYLLSMLAGMNILGPPELAGLYIGIVTLVPGLAASILSRGRLHDLYAPSFYFHPDKYLWYGISVLLACSLAMLTYGIVSLRQPELPPPMVPATNLLAFPAACLFFFITASTEEVGWMGYAFDRMQNRRGTVPAALLLGTFWALWHVPFLNKTLDFALVS